jgi:pimeloyl-ACP methyl ester carboxylesterase
MEARLIEQLSAARQVIAVELQAHGHTADINRPFSFESMVDDIAALIETLGLENADICGYSLGGGTTLQTAIRHPRLVQKLVIISAPGRRDGWYSDVLIGMAMMNAEIAKTWVDSPMHEAYAKAAPRPEDWPVLVAKTGQLLKQNYDWSMEISRIKAPALIVIGDADSVRPAHAVELFELLGGGKADAVWDGLGMPNSRLAVLPATTHYNIVFSPALAPTISAFLYAPMPSPR